MKGSFGYGACRRNQNFLASSPVHDGCLEYLSSRDSLRCEVCGCHRNFHEKTNFAADGLDVQFRSAYIKNEEQGQNFCKENVRAQNANRLVNICDDRVGQGNPQVEKSDNKEQEQTSCKDGVVCQKGQNGSRNKSDAKEENMSGVESGLMHKLCENHSSYQEGNVHGTVALAQRNIETKIYATMITAECKNTGMSAMKSSHELGPFSGGKDVCKSVNNPATCEKPEKYAQRPKVIGSVPMFEEGSFNQAKEVEGSNIVNRLPCKRPDGSNHDGSFEDTVQKKVRLSRALDWGSDGSSDSEEDSDASSLNLSKGDVKAVHHHDKANVVVFSRSPCVVDLNRAVHSKPRDSASTEEDVKVVQPLNYAHHEGLKGMRGLYQSPVNQGPSVPSKPCLFASVSDAVVPGKLKRAFEVLQLDHQDDKLQLCYVNGEWKVRCGICETDLSVDKPGLTLNNVKQHFSSKKHRVNEAFLSSWTPYC